MASPSMEALSACCWKTPIAPLNQRTERMLLRTGRISRHRQAKRHGRKRIHTLEMMGTNFLKAEKFSFCFTLRRLSAIMWFMAASSWPAWIGPMVAILEPPRAGRCPPLDGATCVTETMIWDSWASQLLTYCHHTWSRINQLVKRLLTADVWAIVYLVKWVWRDANVRQTSLRTGARGHSPFLRVRVIHHRWSFPFSPLL